MAKKRCGWCGTEEIYQNYHDNEWGTPIYDDQRLFELLMLETQQAGLSWLTILKKRENYRIAFDDFDAHKIAAYQDDKFDELINNAGIIRNQRKIAAIINNAQSYLALKKETGSFSDYIWQFVAHQPIINHYENAQEVPSTTALSDKMSKDLKKRGFKFIGSTTVYAFMQSAGLVNDHLIKCFKHPNYR